MPKTIEEYTKEIISLLPKTKIVVDVGGEMDEVNLEEVLPFEIEKILKSLISQRERELREKIEGVAEHYEGDDRYPKFVWLKDVLSIIPTHDKE